jgi:subtilisin family serine protease
MRVLIQLRPSATRAEMPSAGLSGEARGGLPAAFALDTAYAPVPIPTPVPEEPGADRFSQAVPKRWATGPRDVTHVVRGTIPDGVAQGSALAEVHAHPDVVGVFSDPVIETTLVCPGDDPVGTAGDVATQTGASALAAKGMDGTRVTVAVVDTGINLDHLRAQGQHPKLDARRSWSPAGVMTKPGKHPVDHGTMCAYDVGITAPKATFVDYAVLLSQAQGQTVMSGLLSDAVLAYSKLRQVLDRMPAARRALVVSNSWGMFSPDWDFPVGAPGNYSDNPAHPFNVIVASLEAAGADILFAAGNCGRDCPDGRCQFGPTRPICGANSHAAVISVGGVDVQRNRAGYSSQGPGRLDAQKPDLCGYTHFDGSKVYPADGGTSAACPVLAGFVAAVRSRHPSTKLPPAQLRTLLYKTAVDLGGTGFDYDYGWGVPDPSAFVAAVDAAVGGAAAHGGRRRSRGRARTRARARGAA